MLLEIEELNGKGADCARPLLWSIFPIFRLCLAGEYLFFRAEHGSIDSHVGHGMFGRRQECLNDPRTVNKMFWPRALPYVSAFPFCSRAPDENQQILRAHILPLTNCAFNKSGDKFITGSYDRTCKVSFSLKNHRALHCTHVPSPNR